MRSFIVMTMLVASFTHAAWHDYTELRELELDADGVEHIEIQAGAGAMKIAGISGLQRIVVQATINVADANNDDAVRTIEKRMRLALSRDNNEVRLESRFDDAWFGSDTNASIDLDIQVPAGIALHITDRSGSIDIKDLVADVSIDDGAGSLKLHNVGNVTIDDGSGSILVTKVAGDVSIVDGSGSITVQSVTGSVSVDDGSGSITVDDVGKDLVIVDDGSGGRNFTGVRGEIRQQT